MQRKTFFKITCIIFTLLLVRLGYAGESGDETHQLSKDLPFDEVQKLYPTMRKDVEIVGFPPFYSVFLDTKSERTLLNILFVFNYDYLRSQTEKAMGNTLKIKEGMEENKILEILGEPDGEDTIRSGQIKILDYDRFSIYIEDGEVTRTRGELKLNFLSDDELANIREELKNMIPGSDYHSFLDDHGSKFDVWVTKERYFVFRDDKLFRWYNEKKRLDSKTVKEIIMSDPLNLEISGVSESFPVEMEPIFMETTLRERDAVRENKLKFGMPRNAVLCSKGEPRDINRTIIRDEVVQEQWVYGRMGGPYLYFKNGRIETIQD